MKEILEINGLSKGIFIERPNRYIAKVEINGLVETVHVHDPGRLKELLYPGNACYVRYAKSPTRKTDWDMIAAQKDDAFVLIHSGYHRYIAEAIMKDETLNPFGQWKDLKAEVKHGDARIDFKMLSIEGTEVWVEVKGCSLSEEGVAKFPDAPTARGLKHLMHLMDIKKEGHRAGVLLLVLSESHTFEPNKKTDPKFYSGFYQALNQGVEIYPVKVLFNPSEGKMYCHDILPIQRAL